MHEPLYLQIAQNSTFRLLVTTRQRFAVILSALMLLVYIGFILLIAFAPEWLGTPLYAGTTVTRGIPIGIGIIIFSFFLTGIYVWRANGEFDRLTQQVIREVNRA